jgi:ATP-dependent DNA helicase RecG
MVIENAERVGLAQLHQLRGRVGRGARQSYCILLFQYPLSEIATQRLSAMRETNDGFEIAQKDLELRGPGEVLGTRQTGMLEFRIVDLMRDQIWIERINHLAQSWLDSHDPIVDKVIARWLKQKNHYGFV